MRNFIFGTLGFLLLVTLVTGNIIFTFATMKEQTITPTNYTYSQNHKGKSVREVFAVEGEYRIKDSWIPWNLNSGTIANKIDQTVKYNDRQTTHAAMLTCKVKTYSVRVPFLSMFPVIYGTDCQTFK